MGGQAEVEARAFPEAEHFEIVEAPVPDVSDGRVLVRNISLPVDPAMRGWVSAVANYSEPVALGAVMRSLAVGRVEESRNSEFGPGDYVTGMFGWQYYAVVDATAIQRKIDGSGLPISTSLGVLGLNGLTRRHCRRARESPAVYRGLPLRRRCGLQGEGS